MDSLSNIWINLSAASALAGVIAYAVFGGADFGGGVWDLFALGPRANDQRRAVQKAMGPVWEANHVWLILVIVILFTCFPAGYSAIGIALFIPFHLVLLGIMLRGAAFIFRSYQARHPEASYKSTTWGTIFGIASLITPLLLGAAFGTVTEGAIHISEDGVVQLAYPLAWLSPYCIANGVLALCTCAYLAAVYLTNETAGDLQQDFRRRAIFAGTATAVMAGVVLVLAYFQAHWFFARLLSARVLPVVMVGLTCFAGSAWAVISGRFLLARIFAILEIGLLILGWGLAQHPYLAYPNLTLNAVAAPHATLKFLVLSLPFGAALVLPSLWLLLNVFKAQDTQPVKSSE